MHRAVRVSRHLLAPRSKLRCGNSLKVGLAAFALTAFSAVGMFSALSQMIGTSAEAEKKDLGSFFKLSAKNIDGENVDFKKYNGNVCYVANVASK
mmetsp:Transcript_46295/g.74452  ORF Transcript_46295/g.74452 Transcript_46295/m.74452 type:complete len:95 (-) Transcript_46295:591-875(-)